MKKQILLTAVAIVTTVVINACKQDNGGALHVSANLKNVPDTLIAMTMEMAINNQPDTIILNDGKGDFTINLDSITVLFVADPQMPDPSEGIIAQLIAVPGESVEIVGDPREEISFGGSKFYKDYNEVNNLLKTVSQETLEEQATEFIKQHPDNQATSFLVLCLGNTNPGKALECAKLLGDEAKGGKLKQWYEETVKQIEEAQRLQNDMQEKQAEGREAPDFELKTIDGGSLKLSSLRGKYVVLDFWGSWCGWCIKGFPDMKEYYNKHKGKFEILGIDCEDKEADWKNTVKEQQLPWLHVYCPQESDLLVQYGIQGFPTKIVITPEGKIAKTFVGEVPEFYQYLDEIIK